MFVGKAVRSHYHVILKCQLTRDEIEGCWVRKKKRMGTTNADRLQMDKSSLVDYVERVFQEESIYVDEAQLERYMDQQKYFPYRLLEWETFCFALHNCVYKAPGRLRWPILIIVVGRGAGKNGYLAFEDFCLIRL